MYMYVIVTCFLIRNEIETLRSPKQKQIKEGLSFDTWKRKKTLVYKRMIKEVKAVEEQKLPKNRAHIEPTKNTKQVYILLHYPFL